MNAPALRVLIACEFTGTVRREFDKLGHDAWSCDLRPAEDGSNRHLRGDVREFLGLGWDLLIVAHPPCTRLCNSGVRWIDDPSKLVNLGEDFTDAERQKIRKERITKKEFYDRGGFANSALFRKQSRGGAWRYYVSLDYVAATTA